MPASLPLESVPTSNSKTELRRQGMFMLYIDVGQGPDMPPVAGPRSKDGTVVDGLTNSNRANTVRRAGLGYRDC